MKEVLQFKQSLLLLQLPGALLGSLLMAAVGLYGYGRMRAYNPHLSPSVLLLPLGLACVFLLFVAALGVALLLLRAREKASAQREELQAPHVSRGSVVPAGFVAAEPIFSGGAQDWWFGAR